MNGTATNVPEGVVVDARFADGKVAGFAGCNTYSASATIADAELTLGQAATTMKACEPDVTAVVTAYRANLALSATFTATADALTIYGADGKQLLASEAAAANPLLGEWIVTGDNTGQEAVTSPLPGTGLTATFTPETAFLAALQAPTTVEPSGTTVTLRDAAGATQVVLAAK